MRTQLTALREKMQEQKMTAYLIPTTDFHGSEYVNDYFKCRKYISGFTGSAGTLIITLDQAFLWTDGRYFLQAEKQLKNTGINLMKMDQNGVPTMMEFLESNLGAGDVLGFDGKVVSCEFGRKLAEKLAPKNVKLSSDHDLVGEVWIERPTIKPSKIYALSDNVTGETSESKLEKIRIEMQKKQASYHLITKLEEIAWLFNLRGRDVENTPVFFAFALIEEKTASLYVMDDDFIESHPSDRFQLKPYFDLFNDLKTLRGPNKILLDERLASYALVQALPPSISILNESNPGEWMKAIKNPVEIANTRAAHVKDGIAMVKFIYWLKKNIGKIPMSEISASDYLEACRRRQPGCFDLSFETISGYGPDGAIIHYFAVPETDKELQPNGFLLVDSGGQYEDGTTDITRTIALGPLSDQMKTHYTAVLRCNIELATSTFSPGTTGITLDQKTRKPLQILGLDYNHGTGHGVGHILSVHEGPNSISPKGGTGPIIPGMITTDEPGVYLEGQYGIRLENELLCLEDNAGQYAFESITLCPFDAAAILPDKLTPQELRYLNDYHAQVYTALSPFLDDEVRLWLAEATKAL